MWKTSETWTASEQTHLISRAPRDSTIWIGQRLELGTPRT